MTAEQTIIQRLDRFNTKLNKLLEGQRRQTWLKATYIIELTGWDHRRLQSAREDGVIKFRGTDRNIEYLLESLPKEFIKSKPHDNIQNNPTRHE